MVAGLQSLIFGGQGPQYCFSPPPPVLLTYLLHFEKRMFILFLPVAWFVPKCHSICRACPFLSIVMPKLGLPTTQPNLMGCPEKQRKAKQNNKNIRQ